MLGNNRYNLTKKSSFKLDTVKTNIVAFYHYYQESDSICFRQLPCLTLNPILK